MVTAEELKEYLVVKGVRNVRRGVEHKEDAERGMYRPGVGLALERARLVTESYKMTETEPMLIRRAKALEYTLSNMTIYIEDYQRIVGNYAESPSMIHIPIEMDSS